ncbi:MAG: hypothetical protein AAFW64_01795 [Pseudomonadota bacterium]
MGMIDVGGRQVVEALVVSLGLLVVDEGTDLPVHVTGQEVILQENPVLHGLVPAFVLRAYAAPLGPRSLQLPWVCGGRTANVIHTLALTIFGDIGRHVGRAVVAGQPWLLDTFRAVTIGCFQRQFQRITRPLFLSQL